MSRHHHHHSSRLYKAETNTKKKVKVEVKTKPFSESKEAVHKEHTEEGMILLSNYKLQSRVINCTHRTRDFNRILNQAMSEGLPVKKKRCVHGVNLSRSNLRDLVKEGSLHSASHMNVVEISNYLSHYSCWHDFLSTDADLLMVLEDDVTLLPDFTPHLESCLQAITDNHEPWNILYLYHSDYLPYQTEKIADLALRPPVELQKIIKVGVPATSAYIITRNFADYLVRTALPVKVPVTVLFMKNQNANGDEAFTLNHRGHWSSVKGRSSPLVMVPGWQEQVTGKSSPLPPINAILESTA